jgi:CubicO group peptidase (beta-lactamase class C family)
MHIDGHCRPEFQAVREAFARNFSERNETGAACCIYFQGNRIVDLWGGEKSPHSPWREDTLGLTFSVSKGMAAAALVVAHGRGLFDLDAPVAEYWPQFGQGGKDRITVRQLLSHQAGLIGIDEPLTLEKLTDPDRMSGILARQRPAWRAGTRHGYHTLTLGWYQAELLRRVDPRGRTLGRYFQEEIARPLGVEFYIGLPEHIDVDRLATTVGFHRLRILLNLGELPLAMILAGMWPRSLVSRSVNPLGLSNPAHLGSAKYRHLEIPSANGFGQARAIAKIYSVLARGGRELRIDRASWRELHATPKSPTGGSRDAILKMDTNYAFGFSRPSRDMRFGYDRSAFGCPGAGGCFGMADPVLQVGFAYITNKMGFRIFDDPRERACREAFYRCLASEGELRKAA